MEQPGWYNSVYGGAPVFSWEEPAKFSGELESPLRPLGNFGPSLVEELPSIFASKPPPVSYPIHPPQYDTPPVNPPQYETPPRFTDRPVVRPEPVLPKGKERVEEWHAREGEWEVPESAYANLGFFPRRESPMECFPEKEPMGAHSGSSGWGSAGAGDPPLDPPRIPSSYGENPLGSGPSSSGSFMYAAGAGGGDGDPPFTPSGGSAMEEDPLGDLLGRVHALELLAQDLSRSVAQILARLDKTEENAKVLEVRVDMSLQKGFNNLYEKLRDQFVAEKSATERKLAAMEENFDRLLAAEQKSVSPVASHERLVWESAVEKKMAQDRADLAELERRVRSLGLNHTSTFAERMSGLEGLVAQSSKEMSAMVTRVAKFHRELPIAIVNTVAESTFPSLLAQNMPKIQQSFCDAVQKLNLSPAGAQELSSPLEALGTQIASVELSVTQCERLLPAVPVLQATVAGLQEATHQQSERLAGLTEAFSKTFKQTYSGLETTYSEVREAILNIQGQVAELKDASKSVSGGCGPKVFFHSVGVSLRLDGCSN